MKYKKISTNNLIIKIFFLLFCILNLFFYSHQVNAQITYKAQVPSLAGPTMVFKNSTSALALYIKSIYNYGIGIVAILATVVMMIGGFQWIIAGGSGEKIGEAKAWIVASLSGLILALSSYMILAMINPALVNFKIDNIKPITKESALCNPGEIEKTFITGNPAIAYLCASACGADIADIGTKFHISDVKLETTTAAGLAKTYCCICK